MAAEKFVLSDRGESLSPNQAPDTTAPAVMAAGMPRLSPAPRRARPRVPTVPQEVPTSRETMAQARQATGRKRAGSSRARAARVSQGTVPQRIQVPMRRPTVSMIPITGTALPTA